MNLSNKFDPNQIYTYDKIVVKHISVKETLLKLNLEPKGQGHSKQQNNKEGRKETKIFHLLRNRARLCLVAVLNDLLRRTVKGKQRSRIIRLNITTTGRFLESMSKLNF